MNQQQVPKSHWPIPPSSSGFQPEGEGESFAPFTLPEGRVKFIASIAFGLNDPTSPPACR